MDDEAPLFLTGGDYVVPRRVAEGRALKPWISPEDVPATARVELSSADGYEEARAVTPAELPSARGEAEAR